MKYNVPIFCIVGEVKLIDNEFENKIEKINLIIDYFSSIEHKHNVKFFIIYYGDNKLNYLSSKFKFNADNVSVDLIYKPDINKTIKELTVLVNCQKEFDKVEVKSYKSTVFFFFNIYKDNTEIAISEFVKASKKKIFRLATVSYKFEKNNTIETEGIINILFSSETFNKSGIEMVFSRDSYFGSVNSNMLSNLDDKLKIEVPSFWDEDDNLL